MRDFHQEMQDVVIAQTGTLSGSFVIPRWATYCGVYCPDIDAATINLQMSLDAGTTKVPVLDPVDGDDYVVIKSGSDPGFIDISDVVRAAPWNKDQFLYYFLSSAAQNSAAVTFKVVFKG